MYRQYVRQRLEIGGYRVIKRIGSGGMSTVFEVEDEGGARYALKSLHPAIVDTQRGRERVQREIATMQKVRSTAVARVVDAEVNENECFIVTELIDGPTLEQDVKDAGVFTGVDLSDLAQALYQAVSTIHAAGVLHRDLKPSNVMMSQNGPVLIDFGIAQMEDEVRLTLTGALSHTPGYCDPRVLEGEDPDEEADWWALAAILAYAATGYHPFGAHGAPAVMRRVISGQADVDVLDAPLAGAFIRALHPHVKRRISIDELLRVIADPEGVRDYEDDAPQNQGRLRLARPHYTSAHEAHGPTFAQYDENASTWQPSLLNSEEGKTEVLSESSPAGLASPSMQESPSLMSTEMMATETMAAQEATRILPDHASGISAEPPSAHNSAYRQAASPMAYWPIEHGQANNLASAFPTLDGEIENHPQPYIPARSLSEDSTHTDPISIQTDLPQADSIKRGTQRMLFPFFAAFLVFFCLVSAYFPVFGACCWFIILFICGWAGRMHMRERGQGGFARVGAALSSPWHALKALLAAVVSGVIGCVGALVAIIVVNFVTNAAQSPPASVLAAGMGAFAMVVLSLAVASGNFVKTGARCIVGVLAPTRAYVWWYVLLIAIACGVVIVVCQGNYAQWAPLPASIRDMGDFLYFPS